MPKRILLFDDDYESMHPLKRHLELVEKLQVELTTDKNLFQRLAHERFDLICVDLMIHPVSLDATDNEVRNVHFDGINWRKTGLEFLRRLRKGEFASGDDSGTSPDVPVVLLSAVANYSIEDELGEDTTINGYVEKPFRLEEIIKLIRKLLGE